MSILDAKFESFIYDYLCKTLADLHNLARQGIRTVRFRPY
jgi:hypothetical protein